MKRTKTLPFGVCRTHFFNQADRKLKLPARRRPCYVAYAGHGRTFRSKRFPIDILGREDALREAIQWRKRRGPLRTRACDAARRARKTTKNLTRSRA